MSIFDEAYERFTGSLGDGGSQEIPKHGAWVEVPAGVAAPGVFERDGEELSFWLYLESHSLRQETAIIQKAMGKRGEMNVARGSAMVRDAIRRVAEFVEPVSEHDLKDSDDAREARSRTLKKAEREWLWKALSQRGRNLVSKRYDDLTEPNAADDEGNG